MPPITQVTVGTPGGLAFIQYWLVGTDGFAYGYNGEGAANGTTMHAALDRTPLTAQLPDPQRVVQTITGGDKPLGQMMFGVNEIGSFQITLGSLNTLLMAASGGSSSDNTYNPRWRLVAPNMKLADLPQMGMIITVRFQSRESGSDGAPLWINYFVPRCQISAAFPQAQYQQKADTTLTVSPTFFEKLPHGVPLSATSMNLAENQALAMAIISAKPLALTTFIGNNVLTTYTLGFRPSSSVVGGSGVTRANDQAVAGVVTAPTSVNTTTAVVTPAATPGLAAQVGMIYETDFAAVA